jgi:PAS domain S-box-containing protein
MRDELFDPESWHESLEAYARTTNLAVALADTEGRLIGTCINPRPTWSRLHAKQAAAGGGCPFSLAPRQPCMCVGDALTTNGLVLARDRTGLVHFTVPLVLGDHPLGVLLAGQVFDKYPEHLLLEQVAKHSGLPPGEIWQGARLEPPVKQATLRVYGRLLATLGNAFLRTHYHTIMETNRLAELSRVHGQLRASEAQFRHMADTAPTMLWITDPTGCCTFRSRSWYECTGQTAATSLGSGWLEAVHPDDRANARDTFLAAHARYKAFRLDYRLRQADGVYRWVIDAGRPRRADSGEFLGYIGAVMDIDDRKQAEAALAERELHLSLAQSAARLGSWQLDLATGTLYASPQCKAHCGLLPDEDLSYTRLFDLIHPDDRDRVRALVRQAVETRTDYDAEYRTAWPDGSLHWISARGRALYEASGQSVRMVGVTLDITAHIQAEQALQQAHNALEHRVQERTAALHQEMAERQRLEHEAQRAEHFVLLGRLAAGVSHEIRNPLAAIFLHVDVVVEEFQRPASDSPVQIARSLQEIRTQLARVEDLVQDYLSLVRVSTIQREVQDLGTAVEAWVREFQAEATARGRTLHVDGIADLGSVAFHANTLRRALLNLVQNALDAIPHGGTVMIAGQGTATQVQLQVRDTGCGIPAERLGQIFEPLYTTKPGGTGLGLYIIREIVTAHGGQVTVASVEGQGTTFTLTLPRAAATAAASEVP